MIIIIIILECEIAFVKIVACSCTACVYWYKFLRNSTITRELLLYAFLIFGRLYNCDFAFASDFAFI